VRALSPPHSADTVEAMARRAFGAVEGFMRGTTLIALIDALCTTVGLLVLLVLPVLPVPGAVGLGALVFVGAYIAYLGAFLSGTVAILVALADHGFVIALWALGVVLAVPLTAAAFGVVHELQGRYAASGPSSASGPKPSAGSGP
jgi:predicted PurR-regulated permease PerM